MDEYLDEMKADIDKAVEALQRDFVKVRTGRASPSLLENVVCQVASYGASMPINQLATVTAPDARLLVVTPWDKTTLHDVERGIVSAALGLNPSSDGQIIRVPVPALTKDRREQLVKQVRQMSEQAKVRIRQVRKDYNDIFRNAEKDKEISEDESRRYVGRVQEITDSGIKAVDDATSAKEAEVLEV